MSPHIPILRTLLEDPERLLVIDTETTGLHPALVVELSVIDGTGRICLDTLINPGAPIDPAASAVHGLSDADVGSAPTWQEVWPDLCNLTDGKIVTTYNLDFDMRSLRESCLHVGLDTTLWTPSAAFCSMLLYAEAWGEPKGCGWKWQRLEAALEQQRLPEPENAHRALSDARSCLALLRHMSLGMCSRCGGILD